MWIAVGAGAALVTIVSAVAIHYGNSRVNGCVRKGPNGFILTDDDGVIMWQLAGETGGLKVGDHMKLKGKREKPAPKGGNVFDVVSVAKDYGPCD